MLYEDYKQLSFVETVTGNKDYFRLFLHGWWELFAVFMESIFADDFFTGIYFRGILLSQTVGKPAKFVKIRNRNKFIISAIKTPTRSVCCI